MQATAQVHNSTDPALKALVERIERLDGEKDDLATDIKAIYAEAKSTGYNIKVIRKLIRERKQDAAKFAAEEEELALYRERIGMIAPALRVVD